MRYTSRLRVTPIIRRRRHLRNERAPVTDVVRPGSVKTDKPAEDCEKIAPSPQSCMIMVGIPDSGKLLLPVPQEIRKSSRSLTLYVVALLSAIGSPSFWLSQATAAPAAPPRYCSEYARTQSLIDKGRCHEAIPVLLSLCNTTWGHNDPILYCRLADCYNHDEETRGHLSLAEAQAQKAVKINPELGRAYELLGANALERDQYSIAVQWATKALTCKAPDIGGLWIRAKAYLEMHKYNEGLADVTAFIKVQNPHQVNTYALKGDFLRALGRGDEAIATYREAMPLGKDWAELQIVRVLQSQNKFAEAVKQVSTIIKDNPIDDDAYYIRAQLLNKLKNYRGALADYSKAIELAPVGRYYLERSHVYDALGQHDLATRDLEESKKSF